MGKDDYKYPFLQLTPLDQYPEIKDVIKFYFPSEPEEIRKNMYAIITNLLVHPIVAVTRSRPKYESFRGPKWYNRNDAVRAQDLLEKTGLTLMEIGYKSKNGQSQSTLIKASKSLEERLKNIIILGIMADQASHSPIAMNKIPLEKEEIDKLDLELFPINSPVKKSLLKKVYGEIVDLNENYFSKMTLGFVPGTIFTPEGLTFREAREKNYEDLRNYGEPTGITTATNVFFTGMFTSRGDGRLFQRCNSYQFLKKMIRQHLTINRHPTAELDFGSMHINLAYFIINGTNPHLDDSYTPVIEDLGLENNALTREAIKKTILILFNTPNPTSAARALNWNHRTEANTLRRAGKNPREVYNSFIKLNPRLQGLLENGFCCANLLMFYESIIMRNILRELEAKKINGLPLHDSVIYDARFKNQVEKTMVGSYKKLTKRPIKVKPPKVIDSKEFGFEFM